MPEANHANFADARLVHEFDDGWQIVSLHSYDDLGWFGKTMRNCWDSSWEYKLAPAPEDEREQIIANFKKRWDTPDYRERFGDEWVEKQIASAETCPLGKRQYVLLAVLDDKGNLRAGSSLGLRDVLDTITYGRCDGLHQSRQSWVELYGLEFCCLELLPYSTNWSYNVTGETLDHFVEWWQGACAGEWQESKALETQKALA